MELKDIRKEIEQSHEELFSWLQKQDPMHWEKGPESKWTTGQHVLHLTQSSQALNKALGLPKFILSYKFSTANRPSRTYAQVKENYETKLLANLGAVSPYSNNLETPTLNKKDATISSLKSTKNVLIKKSDKWNYKQSIKYLLPHPLLGRMTVNEILFWTAIHTRHHLGNLKANY